MNTPLGTIVVAGHICLDIYPTFKHRVSSASEVFVPGKLVDVDSAKFSTGGAVANTGLALHRLGTPARLVAKIGSDEFGGIIRGLLRKAAADMDAHMREADSADTSYSIVLNPPGIDRIFLHCPGTNDTFDSGDISPQSLDDASVFHFGYPPLMRRLYEDSGDELREILRLACGAGLTTSLDMALPDPDSAAGKVPWRAILAKVLPLVDVFVPSIEEIVFMLDPARGLQVRDRAAKGAPLGGLSADDVRDVAGELLEMGAAAVMLKLGSEGAYLRATGDSSRLAQTGRCSRSLESWRGAEAYLPCLRAEVAGTTGAGDTTIAGFLTAILRGLPARDALLRAVATGAACVEHTDPLSGIPHWDELEKRILAGWQHEPAKVFAK